jgi:hypothetical protein
MTLTMSLSLAVLFAPQPASAGDTRICAQDGAQDGRLSIVPKTDKRDRVVGDYVVLVYNARTHLTSWYDYSTKDDISKPIPRNASLFPIVYMKEKMAVHVCGLHFGDTLTVSTNPTGVPEAGADFRGVTPNAAPALQTTVDALSASSSTGSSTQLGSLGLGSPSPLSSLAVSVITPGSNGGKTAGGPANAYTDAVINVSPEQLALAMHAFHRDARLVHVAIEELRKASLRMADVRQQSTKTVSEILQEAGVEEDSGEIPSDILPGSIEYLQAEAMTLLRDLKKIQNKKEDNPDRQNPAAFDEYMSKVQAFIGELGGLNSTLNSDALGARALTLEQNYATITGILGTVDDIIRADRYLDCAKPPTVTPACPLKKDCPPATPASDTVNCRYWEQMTFEEFRARYDSVLKNDLHDTDNITSVVVFDELKGLQAQLQVLDVLTGEVFKMMDRWYEDSSFEDTDLLTPVGGSALERINIIVQRTYVPFTFAASSSSGSGGSTTAGGGGGSQAGAAGGGGAGGAGGAAAAAGAGAGSGSASGAGAAGGGAGGGPGGGGGGGTTTTPAHTVETVLVEVHRRANFNIVGGAMVIRVPTKSFSVQPQIATATVSGGTTVYPASCNGGTPPTNIPAPAGAVSTPYYCATLTQTSDWQVAGMVGVAWFPLGRDYFPRGTSGSLHLHNMIPSFLAATSVTSLGNAFLGPDFEPVNGLDLFVGIASAHQTGLPSSMPLTNVLLPVGNSNGPPTLPTVIHVKAGLTFGVGFDLSVFTQIFSKPASAGLP